MNAPALLIARPFEQTPFAPFGNVIEIDPAATPEWINSGTTARFSDLAPIDIAGKEGRPIVSLARAQPFDLPHRLEMVERHPLGSQAFIPIVPARFLIIVAPDEGGKPGQPLAFLATPGQGVNYHRNIWHAPLAVLDRQTDFIIVDRAGPGDNLEEFRFEVALRVELSVTG
ncbi:MAG: ureidoglycolate lyase [Alphaproteobacteria bacterium]|nr:ureidoglycolate lyase [Alphaproteobacteria bacterium]